VIGKAKPYRGSTRIDPDQKIGDRKSKTLPLINADNADWEKMFPISNFGNTGDFGNDRIASR